MTKSNVNIHVLADETLGGIKREYVEVDRKAEVGEKIVIVEKADCEEGYKNGDVFTVDREYRPADGDVESDGASSDTNYSGLIYREEYRVLEPTDIVHIGTQRFEMIERNANVGEKILTTQTQFGRLPVGKVLTVTDVFDDNSIAEVGVGIGIVEHTDYRVLIPLDKREKTFGNKNRRYKEIKNYIHNELGITRKDIQEMISVAVSNEVQKISESGKLDSIAGEKIESLIDEGFSDGGRLLYGFKERVSQTVSDEVGKRIAKVLNINVELKEERN
ncbi:hypothetical protein [Bacillus subtilis]|uniref:hypothetical protein n=1 Tax=Bacillus subtilis TaxID=1423 RepID=UPI003F86E6C9